MQFNDVVNIVDENEITTTSRNNSNVRVLSVSEYVKLTDQAIRNFGYATVEGEISELKRYSHLYFKIKDELSSVDCIMWQSVANSLHFEPKVGLKVRITGQSSIYQKTGQFKLVAHRMEEVGLGQIMEQLRLLKEKLASQGIFDLHKREIPRFVNTVGVITSSEGQVLHDIERTIELRNDGVHIVLYKALVQGKEAPASLRKALKQAIEDNICDVLIIGRGGGSFEDLLPFSDEALVRDVANCPIPIISAVGHEPDVALTDFAADVRAATPTAAATFVTQVTKQELYAFVTECSERLNNAIASVLDDKKMALANLNQRLKSCNPLLYIQNHEQRLQFLVQQLQHSLQNKITNLNLKLQQLNQNLSQYEPQALVNQKQLKAEALINKLNEAIRNIVDNRVDRLDFDNTKLRLDNALTTLISKRQNTLQQSVLALQSLRLEDKFSSMLQLYQKDLAKLETLNPLAILKRGYSITYNEEHKVASIDNIKLGQELETKLTCGKVISTITQIIKDN